MTNMAIYHAFSFFFSVLQASPASEKNHVQLINILLIIMVLTIIFEFYKSIIL